MGAGERDTRRRVTPGDLRTLWVTFVCGSGILLFGGIHNLLINAFYTASETALPARIEMLTHTAGLAMKQWASCWEG